MQKVILSLFAFVLFVSNSFAAEPAEFASGVVDIGIVAKDVDVTAKFYTEVIGLKEVRGFSVPAEKTKAFGLADSQSVNIRVFVLTEGPNATRLKIMSFPKRPGKAPDQKYIHSTLGLSYLTLRVKDMTAAVARLKKANVKLLGETPASLGGKNRITVFHDPDGNFVELIGPITE